MGVWRIWHDAMLTKQRGAGATHCEQVLLRGLPGLNCSQFSPITLRGRGVRTSTGDVAEWFRQGPAKPCTRVRFPASPLEVRLFFGAAIRAQNSWMPLDT